MAGTDKHQNLIADGPAVVLVEPQLGENIGMVARAMANFGLAELRLVNPRDGWPSEKARAAASVFSVVLMSCLPHWRRPGRHLAEWKHRHGGLARFY